MEVKMRVAVTQPANVFASNDSGYGLMICRIANLMKKQVDI